MVDEPRRRIHYVLGTNVTTTLFKNGVQRDTDFQGRVWGFAIYPIALTPARIAAHYAAGSDVLTTNAS